MSVQPTTLTLQHWRFAPPAALVDPSSVQLPPSSRWSPAGAEPQSFEHLSTFGSNTENHFKSLYYYNSLQNVNIVALL